MSPLGRYSCIAQGEMRAKPEMKPWGNIRNKNYELLKERHLQREHLSLPQGVPPLWGSINVSTNITQGLRPGL